MSTISQVHPLHAADSDLRSKITSWIPVAAPIIGALFMIIGYGRGQKIAEPAYGDV